MDFITQLRAFEKPGQRMCKTLQADGEWSDYGRAKHFTAREVPLSGLDDLETALEVMAGDPWITVIRGQRRAEVVPATTPDLFHDRKPEYMQRSLRVFRDVPHHWVCMDVDHFDSQADVKTDPATAVHEAVRALLPFAFHHVGYVWQLSNSAGFKPGVRAHIWFWLAQPRSSVVLKNWAAANAPGIDRALFNSVQIHYTACPVIEPPNKSPLTQRMGRRVGMLGDAVDLDIDESTLALDGIIDLDTGDIDAPPDPRDKNNYVGAFCRAYSIEDVISDFLPDVFVPQDNRAGRLNYLLAEGGGAGGAFITRDGLHIVNKHNSDPFFNRAVNAFDLVRHYSHGGDADDTTKETSQRASYQAMVQFCQDDERAYAEAGQIPGLAVARAEDDFEPLEDAPAPAADLAAEHDRVGKLIESTAAASFMSEIRFSETHTGSSAFELWKADRVPEDAGHLFEKTGQGNPKNSLHNTIMAFAVDPMLRRCIGYDTFAQRRALYGPLPWRGRDIRPINPGQWHDSDYARLKYYLIDTYGFTPTDQMIMEAMDTVAGWANFHPVQTALRRLEWDGVARLDTWLVDYCHVEDTLYTRAAGARTLIGAVKRVFEPGAKHDTVLVLEGKQGLMKSTAVEVLAGNVDWYREGVPDLSDEKKLVESIRGRWMVELPELSALSRVSIDEAKEVVTRRTDAARMAYGREETVLPRQAIFIGTTNNRDYLRDATGSRRFWPVALGGHIAIDELRAMRDQLMAEAVHRYQAGERNYIGADEPELLAAAQEAQETRYDESPEEERLREWLETAQVGGDTFMAEDDARLDTEGRLMWVTRNDILQDCFGHTSSGNPAVTRNLRRVINRFFERNEDWTSEPVQFRVPGAGNQRTRAYRRKEPEDAPKNLH